MWCIPSSKDFVGNFRFGRSELRRPVAAPSKPAQPPRPGGPLPLAADFGDRTTGLLAKRNLGMEIARLTPLPDQRTIDPDHLGRSW
jgi:hypothetical protein